MTIADYNLLFCFFRTRDESP